MTWEKRISYEEIFQEIMNELDRLEEKGNVAAYIPELKNVDPEKFGVHLATVNNEHYCYGDSDEKFSIQSISKVFSLTMAFEFEGEELWRRVGVEPSGTPFNSLIQLEHEKGIPRNPFINAGALVICDVLVSHLKNPKEELLFFIKNISNNPAIDYSPKIAESEKAAGYRNCALINLMKSYDNIENHIEEVLDLYFYMCSIKMTCKELAQSFLFLAANGVSPFSGEPIISLSKSKRINAIMQTCGLYDEAGEFSFKVGLPGKSGVGGGIVAVHPDKYCLAVWSPRLNKKGNSYRGIEFMERFTTKTELSIF